MTTHEMYLARSISSKVDSCGTLIYASAETDATDNCSRMFGKCRQSASESASTQRGSSHWPWICEKNQCTEYRSNPSPLHPCQCISRDPLAVAALKIFFQKDAQELPYLEVKLAIYEPTFCVDPSFCFSIKMLHYNSEVYTSCVFVLSADVHISIIFGREKLRTVAALVAARIMQCLNVIRHCVPSWGCLSTQEALELNQTPRSFNLLNTLIHPGQVA